MSTSVRSENRDPFTQFSGRTGLPKKCLSVPTRTPTRVDGNLHYRNGYLTTK